MKNIFAPLSILFTLLFIVNTSLMAQTYQAINMNSTENGTTQGDSLAYFTLYGVDNGEEVKCTINRTQFDDGLISHYRVTLEDETNPAVSYYSIFESNTLTFNIAPQFVRNQMKISVIDVNRTSLSNPGYPGQNFEISVEQGEYNQIYTESFNYGMNGWEGYTHPGAEGYFDIDIYNYTRKEFRISVLNEGTESWHVHARKTGISLVAGKTYKVMFKAKTEDVGLEKTFQVKLEEDGNDYTCYGQNVFTANSAFQDYSFKFIAPSSDANSVICVEAGYFGSQDPLDLVIDNIKIYEYVD